MVITSRSREEASQQHRERNRERNREKIKNKNQEQIREQRTRTISTHVRDDTPPRGLRPLYDAERRLALRDGPDHKAQPEPPRPEVHVEATAVVLVKLRLGPFRARLLVVPERRAERLGRKVALVIRPELQQRHSETRQINEGEEREREKERGMCGLHRSRVGARGGVV